MTYSAFLSFLEIVLETLGVGVMCFGILMGIYRAVRGSRVGNMKHIYTHMREELARSILLGLEILIAVDIIKTVTTELTFESTINLALIVLIRTILSISLEVEISHKFPWSGRKKEE